MQRLWCTRESRDVIVTALSVLLALSGLYTFEIKP